MTQPSAQPSEPAGGEPAPAGAFATTGVPGTPGYAAADDVAARLAPPRSLWLMALGDMARRTGARIGLAWVGLLALVAAFAPFLANSRPVLAKTAAGWESPLWRGLGAVDLALPLIVLGLGGIWVASRFRRLGPRLAAGLALAVVAGACGAGFLIADPPRLERFSEYRDAAEDGTYDRVLWAPIPFSPNDGLRDLGRTRTAAPSWLPNATAENLPTWHWLGTTVNGEDMASRMIFAARVALAIGFVATGISTVVGVIVGAIMGYFAGAVDLLLMRVVEIVQAVPVLIVLLIVTTFFGKDIWLMMTTIGVLTWTADARFIRAEFLRLRDQEFVQAARAAGLPTRSLLFRHMLPNGVAPVLVNASFGIAGAILLESTLSFLGLGLEAKDPSWGQLLNQSRSGGSGFNWWIAMFPGLAIFLTVFAYILIGEAMRDAIDPKTRKAA